LDVVEVYSSYFREYKIPGYSYILWTYDLEKYTFKQYNTVGNWPSFTPDGKKVVITKQNQETGCSELWLMDLAKDVGFLILSSSIITFGESSVSPNGKKIAFVGIVKEKTSAKNTPTNFGYLHC